MCFVWRQWRQYLGVHVQIKNDLHNVKGNRKVVFDIAFEIQWTRKKTTSNRVHFSENLEWILIFLLVFSEICLNFVNNFFVVSLLLGKFTKKHHSMLLKENWKVKRPIVKIDATVVTKSFHELKRPSPAQAVDSNERKWDGF